MASGNITMLLPHNHCSLQKACLSGRTDMVKLLIASG